MISKERLKEFESVIKKYILFRFQKFLPESSVILLNNNDYTNIDYNQENLTEIDAKCDMIRNMLYDIISITCELNVEVSKNHFKDVIYGEHLENGLIEYYALEVAKANGLDLKINPDNKEDLAMVLEIYRVLNNKLDSMTFTSNAIEILEAANIDDIIELNDKYAIDEYINAETITKLKGISKEDQEEAKKKEEELKKVEVGSKEETEQMNKEFAVDGVLQIIYANGKRKVKYTDEHNVTHLLNVDDAYALSDIYRREFTQTKKGGPIDSKKVFEELKQKFGEMPLDDELDERKINPDKVKSTEFVNQSNSKFKEKINDGKVVFNEDANLFVLPETKEVVETKSNSEGIEATVSGKEETENTTLGPDDINPVSDKGLEQEGKMDQQEIDEVKEKAQNNSLSLDELRKLKEALVQEAKNEGNQEEAERIVEEIDTDELKKINSELQEKGPTLKKKSAYVNKPLLFFILCMIISISLIIGAILAYFR